MLEPLLTRARYLVLIAVFGALLAALTLLVYGSLEAVALIVHAVAAQSVSSQGAKALTLGFIEIIDMYLLGTVCLITALGLYELFVNDALELPSWLVIRSLDDLKHKLIGVVIVVLGVVFLGHVVNWDGERDILGYGVAIALVIAALTVSFAKPAAKAAAPDTAAGDAH
jgi:uncharacterized membrane protein YqhA